MICQSRHPSVGVQLFDFYRRRRKARGRIVDLDAAVESKRRWSAKFAVNGIAGCVHLAAKHGKIRRIRGRDRFIERKVREKQVDGENIALHKLGFAVQLEIAFSLLEKRLPVRLKFTVSELLEYSQPSMPLASIVDRESSLSGQFRRL
jgi:hypothetical protein